MYKILISQLVIWTFLLPSAASAALRYDVLWEITRDDETIKFIERVTADGENVRIDILDTDHNPDGSYMITNDNGKTMALNDNKQSICSEWDSTEFFRSTGALINKYQKRFKGEISDVVTTVVSREDGIELQGYPTQHLTLRTDYKGSGGFMFIKLKYRFEEHDEIWTTDALDVPDVAANLLEAQSNTGNEFLDDHIKEWNDNVDGIILKQTNIIKMINEKSGKEQVKTEHFEIANISQVDSSDIEPGIFTLPDCKKVDEKEMKDESINMLLDYIQ